MVRAKFKVEQVTHCEHGGEVQLQAVTTGSDENKTFWKYTPSGIIKMHIDNASALEVFKPGQEHYVDFSPAAV